MYNVVLKIYPDQKESVEIAFCEFEGDANAYFWVYPKIDESIARKIVKYLIDRDHALHEYNVKSVENGSFVVLQHSSLCKGGLCTVLRQGGAE